MTQKRWIMVFVAVIAAMAGLYIFLTHGHANGDIAEIYSEEKLVRTVDLSTAEDEVFTVCAGSGGENIIEIKDGSIRVTKASCADGICVRHGPLADSGTPIICLPNRLVIRWKNGAGQVDN